jgi:hypothetical protein
MNKAAVKLLAEALETNNASAIRQIGRENNLTAEALMVYLTEAAGLLWATNKQPSRSPLFEALMTLGTELDAPAIAWAVIERKRRERLPQAKKTFMR